MSMNSHSVNVNEQPKAKKSNNCCSCLFGLIFVIGAIINIILASIIFLGVENYHKSDPVKLYDVFEGPKFSQTNSLLDNQQYLILYGQLNTGIINFVEHQANIRTADGKAVVLRELEDNVVSKQIKETRYFVQMYLGQIGRGHHTWFILIKDTDTPDQEIQNIKSKYPKDTIVLVTHKELEIQGFVNHEFPTLSAKQLKQFMEKDLNMDKKQVKQVVNDAVDKTVPSIIASYKDHQQKKIEAEAEAQRLRIQQQLEQQRLKEEEEQRQRLEQQERIRLEAKSENDDQSDKKKSKKGKGKGKKAKQQKEPKQSKKDKKSNKNQDDEQQQVQQEQKKSQKRSKKSSDEKNEKKEKKEKKANKSNKKQAKQQQVEEQSVAEQEDQKQNEQQIKQQQQKPSKKSKKLNNKKQKDPKKEQSPKKSKKSKKTETEEVQEATETVAVVESQQPVVVIQQATQASQQPIQASSQEASQVARKISQEQVQGQQNSQPQDQVQADQE